jgi:hypothetical protein
MFRIQFKNIFRKYKAMGYDDFMARYLTYKELCSNKLIICGKTL